MYSIKYIKIFKKNFNILKYILLLLNSYENNVQINFKM